MNRYKKELRGKRKGRRWEVFGGGGGTKKMKEIWGLSYEERKATGKKCYVLDVSACAMWKRQGRGNGWNEEGGEGRGEYGGEYTWDGISGLRLQAESIPQCATRALYIHLHDGTQKFLEIYLNSIRQEERGREGKYKRRWRASACNSAKNIGNSQKNESVDGDVMIIFFLIFSGNAKYSFFPLNPPLLPPLWYEMGFHLFIRWREIVQAHKV